MRSVQRLFAVWLLLSMAAFVRLSAAEPCPAEQHPTFRVAVAPELAGAAVSGRLIVMMSNQPVPEGKMAPSFGPDAHSVWVAAKEVHGLTPQTPVELDPDELAYPAPFCNAPAGNYKIKAVLDVDHNFAYYDDSSDGDLLSVTAEQNFNPASNNRISLTLTQRQTDSPLQLPPHTELIDFVSPALSEFWGRPIHMRGCDRVAARLRQQQDSLSHGVPDPWFWRGHEESDPAQCGEHKQVDGRKEDPGNDLGDSAGGFSHRHPRVRRFRK